MTYVDGLRTVLIERGATEQMLNSKTATMVFDAIVDNEVLASETARAEMDRIDGRLKQLEKTQENLAKMSRDFQKKLKAADELASQEIISDPSVIDGLLAYRKMLEITCDVFGEESMTEEVICKTIEAASYGMWRSVMGPKDASRSVNRRQAIL